MCCLKIILVSPVLILGEEGVDPSEARRGVAGLAALDGRGSELFRPPIPGLRRIEKYSIDLNLKRNVLQIYFIHTCNIYSNIYNSFEGLIFEFYSLYYLASFPINSSALSAKIFCLFLTW